MKRTANKLTNNLSTDVFELRLGSSDKDADRFADWRWAQSFTPATHVVHIDDEERKWTCCSKHIIKQRKLTSLE